MGLLPGGEWEGRWTGWPTHWDWFTHIRMQLRIHLLTVRGSFSPQSVHPSVQPFGALSTCAWKGIGLQSQQEGKEEEATKATVVRITIIISRPWVGTSTSTVRAYLRHLHLIHLTLWRSTRHWLSSDTRRPTPDTHRWQVNTALQLNCECNRARLPHCRVGGLSSSPGISAEQAVFNELDLRSFN